MGPPVHGAANGARAAAIGSAQVADGTMAMKSSGSFGLSPSPCIAGVWPEAHHASHGRCEESGMDGAGMVERLVSAFNAHDAEAFSAAFAKDGVMYEFPDQAVGQG